MRRRLTILLVDAVILSGVAAVALALLRFDFSPTEGAEPSASVPVLEADAAEFALPAGRVAVSARVMAERSTHLILPGDRVNVSRGDSASPLLRGAEILRIDPPLMSGDDRVLMTFSLTAETAARLRSLREETLLFVSLSGIGTPPARAGFEPPAPTEVLTLRFEKRGWSKRLTAQ